MTYSDEERRCLRRWEGLEAHVLEGLDRIDRLAAERGSRFGPEVHLALIEDRGRAVEIRRRLNVDHKTRLKRVSNG